MPFSETRLGGLRWGHGGKRCAAFRESGPKPLAAWAAQAGEDTKRRRNEIRAFVEDRKLELHSTQGPLHIEQPGA